MKNKIILIGLLSYLGFFTACGGGSSDSPSQIVDRNEALVQDFNSAETNKRIYVEIRDFNTTISNENIQEWKEKIANYAQVSWVNYEGYGFKSPATGSEDGREVLKIFLEAAADYYSGSASPGQEWLRIAGPPLRTDNQLNLETTIAHEMFHSIQFKSNLGRFSNTLTEGTATLVPGLISIAQHEETSTEYSCDSMYLGNPEGNMWFRPAGSDAHNVCASSLWWRYVSQQLSSMDASQYDYGIDTVKEMFTHFERPNGWIFQESDKLLYAKDFNANSIDEILVQSDTHLGLISPILYNPTSVDIVSDGGQFGNEWRYNVNDKVVGACHLGGSDGSAFLLQSTTHFGIIGMENDSFKTKGVISYGEPLGTDGWVIQEEDKILATRDFDAEGRCEFLIQSSSHLGLVSYRNGAFKTLTSRLINNRLGTNGWMLKASDAVVGTGDFNGDGSIDFVLKSSSDIGVITYDTTIQAFKTLGSMNHISTDTTQYFVGRIKNSDAERLIIGSPSGINIFALGSNANMEQISSISPTQIGNTFTGQLTLAKFLLLTDLDGNGEKELLIRHEDGTLIAGKLNVNEQLTRLATASTTEELNDSLNGAQYRTKWTPSTSYKVLLNADLDGDGKDELFIRDNDRTFVLDLNDSNNFTVNTEVFNNNRLDSLITRTDNFIKSKTSQERNLHSFFNDFAVANYLNSLEGVSESKYKYARKEAIDVDHNPNTPPVHFRVRTNVTEDSTLETIKQEAWAINYFEFSSTSSAIGLAAQMKNNIKNASYTFLVVKENQLIRKAQSSGENFLRTIVLEEGEKVVLIITSFDAPLEYNIHVSL